MPVRAHNEPDPCSRAAGPVPADSAAGHLAHQIRMDVAEAGEGLLGEV